jgi:phosphoglycolate phosphatase-like HAD superfamily hydrolase
MVLEKTTPQSICIIFDFDGTIANTHDILVNINNRYVKKIGSKEISSQEYKRLRSMHIRRALQELGISLMRLPFIMRTVLKEMSRNMIDAQPYDGIDQALHMLKQKGYKLGIVTCNKITTVNTFLQAHNLAVFDFIRSSSYFFGKHRALKKALRDYNIATNAIYVGDEIRDIQAARRCSLHSVAVSWGYNTRETLEQARPTAIIDNPHDLVKTIQSILQ